MSEREDWQPTHRHYKGGLYRELMRGFWEPTVEGAVVYENKDGIVWIRNAVEFDDPNRFQPLASPPSDTSL